MFNLQLKYKTIIILTLKGKNKRKNGWIKENICSNVYHFKYIITILFRENKNFDWMQRNQKKKGNKERLIYGYYGNYSKIFFTAKIIL